MDVIAEVEGLDVSLEAETGFHLKPQAIKDADARLHQNLAAVAFAVCYPRDATEESLATDTLTWTLRPPRSDVPVTWSEGNVLDLASAVRQAPVSRSDADIAAKQLSDVLDTIVQRLGQPVRQELARVLDLPSGGKTTYTEERTDRWFVPAKRGMLVVATAMLFHHRVQPHLPALRPAGFDGVWPPENPTSCAADAAPIVAWQEAWRGILAVDYRPVFEAGGVALEALKADPNASQAVGSLARVVASIAEQMPTIRQDLLGRIFHKVLDTARYDGSFYTSTAAATMLAALALRPEDADWADANAIANLRICDPACGTGTLLMAAAERIRDLRAAASLGEMSAEDDMLLGHAMVEDVLYGYDSNLTATHMAASALGMLSPRTQFSHMNVHRVRLGVHEDMPYLGSLEWLDGQARLEAWPSQSQQVETGEGLSGPPPPMDLVIMNPPFTRDSLRYDQFTAEEEKLIKKRERTVFRSRPVHMSGNSGAFLLLAEQFCNPDMATLAAVLPLVSLTDYSGHEVRQFLEKQFHIDTIVSTHDPARIFFSENTTIGEALLICRRWTSDEPKPPTKVINLVDNPSTPVEALDVAHRITNVRSGGGDEGFTVQWVAAERIARGDWLAVNFLAPWLTSAYRQLTETGGQVVPITEIGKLAEVGPAGQGIRGVYTKSYLPTASGRRALWHHKTNVTQSMLSESDVYIEPKKGQEALAAKYWTKRGDMLLPTRLRLNTSRVAAVMLSEMCLGSSWVPCSPHKSELKKPLCLYLNSALGILTLIGTRDNRVPSYPSYSIDTLRNLLVPNFAQLDESAHDYLTSQFDWLKGETLLPLPEMHRDPVRRQIDDAVCTVMGYDREWVARIRRELAREPAIQNKGAADAEDIDDDD